MLAFSKDCDLLRYESAVFGDLHFSWQVLCSGVGGVLAGSSFSAGGVDFVSRGVEAGGVIYLRDSAGGIDGAYEIVSVDSAEELTVSVVRADESGAAIGIGNGSEVSWRVSTFLPQANEVLFELTQYLGIGPGDSESPYGVDDIVDASVLRQVSIYGVLARVYVSLGKVGDESDDLWLKSQHYHELFKKARQRCKFCVDLGGDGVSDKVISGGSFDLRRR